MFRVSFLYITSYTGGASYQNSSTLSHRYREKICRKALHPRSQVLFVVNKRLQISFWQLASFETLASGIREERKSKSHLLPSFLSPSMWSRITASSVSFFFFLPALFLFSLVCAVLKGYFRTYIELLQQNICFNLLLLSVRNVDIWMYITNPPSQDLWPFSIKPLCQFTFSLAITQWNSYFSSAWAITGKNMNDNTEVLIYLYGML